jgi:hypothetical protein
MNAQTQHSFLSPVMIFLTLPFFLFLLRTFDASIDNVYIFVEHVAIFFLFLLPEMTFYARSPCVTVV